jgi:hypothetical protein
MKLKFAGDYSEEKGEFEFIRINSIWGADKI